MKHTAHSTRRSQLVLLFGLASLGLLASTGCQELGTIDPAQAQVVQFGSCGEVESYVKSEAYESAQQITALQETGGTFDPFGYSSSIAPSSGSGTSGAIPHSITNNQELGVDEADIFQVDGTHAFALHQGRLVIVEALGDTQNGGILKVNGAKIAADVAIDGTPIEMFLDGNTVVVITKITHKEVAMLYQSASSLPSRSDNDSVVEAIVFDVSDRSNPTRVREVSGEGDYIAARRVQNQLYLVARADLGGPKLIPPAASENFAAWAQEQAAVIDASGLDSWLPYSYSKSWNGYLSTQTAQRASCASAYTSRSASGDAALGIYNFDLANNASPVQTTTFIGDGTLIYASTEAIIVAHTNYADTKFKDGGSENVEATTLHRFTMSKDGGTSYWATGIVHGWILNQFSISEYNGYLRIATQMNRAGDGYKPINVFPLPLEPEVIEPNPEDVKLQSDDPQRYLRVVGELVDISHGEDLYAVRFMGNIGYVITWAEVTGDPLFTIDLSNQATPEIRGQLEIPGFSTYLHPIDGGRLIGVGTDTTNNSVKLSLFSVANLSNPSALQEISVGGSSSTSEAIDEHRAFRYLEDQHLMALPISGSRKTMNLYRVNDRSISEAAAIEDNGAELRRSYFIGDNLYILSDSGLVVVGLDNLAINARLSF